MPEVIRIENTADLSSASLENRNPHEIRTIYIHQPYTQEGPCYIGRFRLHPRETLIAENVQVIIHDDDTPFHVTGLGNSFIEARKLRSITLHGKASAKVFDTVSVARCHDKAQLIAKGISRVLALGDSVVTAETIFNGSIRKKAYARFKEGMVSAYGDSLVETVDNSTATVNLSGNSTAILRGVASAIPASENVKIVALQATRIDQGIAGMIIALDRSLVQGSARRLLLDQFATKIGSNREGGEIIRRGPTAAELTQTYANIRADEKQMTPIFTQEVPPSWAYYLSPWDLNFEKRWAHVGEYLFPPFHTSSSYVTLYNGPHMDRITLSELIERSFADPRYTYRRWQ